MKNYIKALALFSALIAQVSTFVSCTLEREDYTEISSDNFPKTENDLKLAVNALMYEFGTGYWSGEAIYSADYGGYQVMSDMTTDCLWSCWGWQSDVLYYQQWVDNHTSSITSYFYNAFTHYQFLSKARNTIRRIEASDAPQEAKTLYAAEAHALRGWMALYLYDMFGTVPVATDDQLDDPTTYNYIGRVTDEEFDDMMEYDLRAAIDDLPETAARGRMTKGAARMILLKYYMIRGKFSEAETLARELYAMENTVYSLQSDYEYIFSKSGLGNNEIILQVGCNASSSWTANYMTAEVLPADMPWTDKAAGWGGYVMPWAFYETFEKGDKRLSCVYANYTTSAGKYMDKTNSSQLSYGALPLKYGRDDEMSGSQSGIDLVIYRFSDVLLTLSECIVRNKGVNAEALDLLNRVRNRAGLASLDMMDKDTFLEALLTERGHEFYLEGLRRQDLIRFGKYAEYANQRITKVDPSGANGYYQVTDVHNLFPIPQDYIDESMSAIKQNPGY